MLESDPNARKLRAFIFIEHSEKGGSFVDSVQFAEYSPGRAGHERRVVSNPVDRPAHGSRTQQFGALAKQPGMRIVEAAAQSSVDEEKVGHFPFIVVRDDRLEDSCTGPWTRYSR